MQHTEKTAQKLSLDNKYLLKEGSKHQAAELKDNKATECWLKVNYSWQIMCPISLASFSLVTAIGGLSIPVVVSVVFAHF